MMENASNQGFPGELKKVLKELQGLRRATVTGAAGDTPVAVAGLDDDDTLLSVYSLDAAGQPTDRTSGMSIVSRRASGTIQVGTEVEDDTVTVQGIVYTLRATLTGTGNEVLIGVDADATAVNLAAAINNAEVNRAGGALLKATVSTDTVTVTAYVKGTAGNAYTLAQSAASFTLSGAVLENGADDSSIVTSDVLTGLALDVWYWSKQN